MCVNVMCVQVSMEDRKCGIYGVRVPGVCAPLDVSTGNHSGPGEVKVHLSLSAALICY